VRPADDIVVIKDPEHPDWMWSTSITEIDGRYLELCISKDSSRVRAPSLLCYTESTHPTLSSLRRNTSFGLQISKRMRLAQI
jgi:hypothetical protein